MRCVGHRRCQSHTVFATAINASGLSSIIPRQYFQQFDLEREV
jgi:hypothetical protein